MFELERPFDAGYATVVLRDPARGIEVTFVPELSMLGSSLRHRGAELLYMADGLEAYAQTGKTRGIPLLYPWANRLSADEFTYAGTRVDLQAPGAPPLRDGNGLPIHGLLTGTRSWTLIEESANAQAASVAYRFDITQHADLLAKFPFPHTVEIRATLDPRKLRIDTTIEALEAGVPVSFGYHPYFTLPEDPRDAWRIELPVAEQLELDPQMIPTGARQPCAFPLAALADRAFDDGFAKVDTNRPFVLEGSRHRIAVAFDTGFPVAQVYAPAGKSFVCFEPMTAPINALRDTVAEVPCALPDRPFRASWSIQVSDT